MAYFVASSTGITIVAAENSLEETKYSPVYGEEMDVKFILDSLPDFYRNFMEGKEYLYSLWGGASQIITSDLLNLYQIDYSKSLRDIPTFTQRKWTRFELENEVDFSYDPSFSTSGVAGKFTYSSSNQNLSASFTQRSGGVDRYYKNLNGTLNEQSSLVWSADVSVTSADSISAILFGYLSQSSTDLSGSLLVGLVKFSSSIRVCVFHTPTKGVASVGRIGSTDLSTSTDYEVRAEYSSSESSVVVSVTEKRFQRLASTSGTTLADEDGGLTVRLLSDSLVDFVVSGVEVGDFVVFGGYSHEIVEVAQNSLTVKYNTLPASATSMGYTVVGPKLIDSVSLNLLNESSKTLSCDAFGLITPVPFDLRDVYTSLVSSVVYSAHTGKSMVCTVDNVSYSDPTFAETPIRIPKLQDSPLSPTSTKQQNVDYTVQSSQISFSLPTEGVWHSEFGLFDEEIVYDNFGANAGITRATSSDEFVNRVRGLYYSLLSGPTVASIKTGVLASVGLPIAVEAGEVTAINPAYSGQKGLITINNSRNYLYPLAVGTDLSLGDSVDQFQPLSRGVDVYDYINNPTWFNDFPVIKEVQKYHTFLVNLDLDALDASVSDSEEVFSAAARHLQVVKPTYKDFVFVGSRSLSDVTGIDDSILLSLTLHVEDAITEPYPAYDDSRFFAPAYDWAYDQGITEWDEVPSSVAYFSYENTESKLWRGSSDQSQFLSDSSSEVEEDATSFTDSSFDFLGTIGAVASKIGTGGSTDSSASMIFTGDSAEVFLTSIKTSGGTPIRDTVVVISSGSTYGVATVTSVLSDTQLQTSYTSSALKGLSSVSYEVRSAGPTGEILLDEANGGTIGSGTLDKFSDTGATFLTDVPNTSGVPDRPTYVAINSSSASPEIREVTNVDSDTVLSVSPDWSGAATNEDYSVWVPDTALVATLGNTGTFYASGSTATSNYDTIVTSTTGETVYVDSTFFGLKDTTPSNEPSALNIDEGHSLRIDSPSGIAGNYQVTGLYKSGGVNYIVTSPAITGAHTSVNYEIRKGRFHHAADSSGTTLSEPYPVLEIESGPNAGSYTISSVGFVADQGITSATISGVFPGTGSSAGRWYAREFDWTRVAYVASSTKIFFTKAWEGDGKDSSSDSGGGVGAKLVTYTSERKPVFWSDVDIRVLGVYYDQSDELSPDELVVLEFTPSFAFGATAWLDDDTITGAAATGESILYSTMDDGKHLSLSGKSSTSVTPTTGAFLFPNGRTRSFLGSSTYPAYFNETMSYVLNFSVDGSDYDELISGDSGTVSGDAVVTTVGGATALSLDGTGDFVSWAASAANLNTIGTDDFYISMWIYVSSMPASEAALVSRGTAAMQLSLLSTGELRLYVGGSTNYATTSGASISTGSWKHIYVHRDGSDAVFYVDGSAVTDSVTGTLGSGSSVVALHVGSTSGGGDYFTGAISDLVLGKDGLLSERHIAVLNAAGENNFATGLEGRSLLRSGVVELEGSSTIGQNESGADYSAEPLFLFAGSAVKSGFTATITNGSPTITFTGSTVDALSHLFSVGDLIQIVPVDSSYTHTHSTTVERIDSITESSAGTFTSGDSITLSENYSGTTFSSISMLIVVRSTSSISTSMTSTYYTLSDEDYVGVEVPGSDLTMIHTVPENEFL